MAHRILLRALPLAALALLGCNEPGQTEIARGNVLASRKQFEPAAEAYRAAATLSPTKARPRELLGHLLSDQKRTAEARAAYEDALQVEPDGAMEARLGLARLEAEAGKLDRAVELLGAVLAKEPGNLYALLSRANLAIKRGTPADLEQALVDTGRAMDVNAKSESVLYQRGRAFLAAGKLPEAAQAFSLLREAHPASHLATYGEAQVAAARGDAPAAVERLKAARQQASAAGAAWVPDEIRGDRAFQALVADPGFSSAVGP